MNQLVGDISVGQQQKVEILKILYKSAEYIVFDEPTAVLTPEETDMLFESMRALKRKGKTVVFISHKLQEVLEISDRISVLKNGRLTGTVSAKETNANELVKMMVGHVIDMEKTPLKVRPGETVFCAEKISVPKSGFRCGLNDIDFSIRGGEVLGVAGVDGNGQNELMDVILGIEKTSSGRLVLNGKDVTGMRSSERRKRGISCIPPDRHRQGIVLDGSIRENMILGCEYFAKVRKGFLIDREKSGQLAQELCTEYDVKMAGVDEKIRNLSGGNQQKVILARECGVRQSELIVAVNPTRGLDIGAMEFVYQMLEGYKKQGKAILLISTELTEIMRLSDNIAILFKGKIMDVLARQEADVKKIGTLMGGLKKEVGQNDGATIVH